MEFIYNSITPTRLEGLQHGKDGEWPGGDLLDQKANFHISVAPVQKPLKSATVTCLSRASVSPVLEVQHEMAQTALGKNELVATCLLVDITGSMQPSIESIKTGISQACTALAADANVRMKVAFVGYRDICDGSQRFVIHDFDEPANIAKLMETINAAGGGDEAEDVIGGLEQVAALNWVGDVRQLIHITDAPAHGRQFHGDDVGDDHPEGLPGQNPAHTLSHLHSMRIHYKMVLAKPQEKMFKAFQALFEQEKDHDCILTKYRVKHDMSDLMSIFTRASSASIAGHRSGIHPGVMPPPPGRPMPVVAENRAPSLVVNVSPAPVAPRPSPSLVVNVAPAPAAPLPSPSLVVNVAPVPLPPSMVVNVAPAPPVPFPSGSLVVPMAAAPPCPATSTVYGVTTPAPPRASLFVATPRAPACPPTSSVHHM
ncbi:hypothetical protein PAPYR_502 [Paratrimastix pyriformis]|uniref:Hemicentin-1-like von Willebrand factor A domain-containing protein n=1 Tax=Paratrimastix pyriformis TaxID=342808 RepID=A0ABQ8UY74_9EUKA|nr:hypothetical protein PAPYR_502 [Paratrimastix pyriformis]